MIESGSGVTVGKVVALDNAPPDKPAALALVEAATPKVQPFALGAPSYALPRTIAELKQLGELLYASGNFKDIRSAAQACVKIAAGSALGYDPITSMNAFHMFDGKIAPTAGEISARIKRSGIYRDRAWFIDEAGNKLDPIRDHARVPNGCVVLIKEKVDGVWEELEPSVFTKQDAVLAGLVGKTNWKSYPRNMLYARALTNAARWHCADVFGGPVYTIEELNPNVQLEMDAEGEMVVVGSSAADAEPDRRPLTAPALTLLYTEARFFNPDLPGDVKVWAVENVSGYVKGANLKKAQAFEIEDKLRALLEAAKPPANGAESTATVPQAADAPIVPPEDAGAPQSLFARPPAHDGSTMTKLTQGRLFALLGDLGIKERDERLSWARSFGPPLSELKSYGDLCDPQAAWLADRAEEGVREERAAQAPDGLFHGKGQCEACNAFPDNPHAVGCPEGLLE